MMSMSVDKSKIAIVLLAYADFEALEIALAAYSKFLPSEVPFYILQNGRGTYDCERTYRVAQRYENLYPNSFKVIDWISPKAPYYSIQELLNSEELKQYDYICKVDDDVFPLTAGWLDKLIKCYEVSKEEYGDNLGYVTSLVNNNPWGFKETLRICGLEDEYFSNISMPHIAGNIHDEIDTCIQMKSNEIYTGGFGTIWRNPYISRWLHKNTSLCPQKLIDCCQNEKYKEVNNQQRYSINCIVFEKDLWNKMFLSGHDDEFMVAKYCKDHDKKIIADLSNPFVHLCFYTQREENRDLLPQFRQVYEKFLDLPYPISMCPNKEYENENRLRYLECKLNTISPKKTKGFWQFLFSVKNDEDKKHKIITMFGIKFKIRR